MATEATFTVPSDHFPLGSVFDQLPEVTVELERIVPVRNVVVPYFWVRGTAVDDIEGVFSDHPGVRTIQLVESVADESLLRVEWTLGYNGVLNTLAETDLVLVETIGTNVRWTFQVRGDNRNDIESFEQRCRESDIPITLTKLHALAPIGSDLEAVVTEAQQEALVLAHNRGYFNSPRDVTMDELGMELGITQQAVSSRLRRGIDQILGRTLSETGALERWIT